MHVCREGSNRADPSRHFFVRTKHTKGTLVEDAKKTRGREEDTWRGREDRIAADAYSRERISHRSGKMGVISVVARY